MIPVDYHGIDSGQLACTRLSSNAPPPRRWHRTTGVRMIARLEAHGLYRDFGATHAVEGVELVVMPGQVHALVGLNGAGKTTLMRLLLGMLRPDRGAISIGGVPLTEL